MPVFQNAAVPLMEGPLMEVCLCCTHRPVLQSSLYKWYTHGTENDSFKMQLSHLWRVHLWRFDCLAFSSQFYISHSAASSSLAFSSQFYSRPSIVGNPRDRKWHFQNAAVVGLASLTNHRIHYHTILHFQSTLIA